MTDTAVDGTAPLEPIRETLAPKRIAADVSRPLAKAPDTPLRVIVEFNANFPGGPGVARRILFNQFITPDLPWLMWRPLDMVAEAEEAVVHGDPPRIDRTQVEVFNSFLTQSFLFLSADAAATYALAELTASLPSVEGRFPLVYKIWLDQALSPQVVTSNRTVKADAARRTFDCAGDDIVWAVADTGVMRDHPHFRTHNTLGLPAGIWHRDFTREQSRQLSEEAAQTDRAGHGTHVAGIIAGVTRVEPGSQGLVRRFRVHGLPETNEVSNRYERVSEISGMAPLCKIVSLKVLEAEGGGHVSRLIAAVNYVRVINEATPAKKIHGLNLSLGYPFDIETYGAGQSPLCREVNKLVDSGVVVVASAGNGGYGSVNVLRGAGQRAGLLSTITDPGNAEQAITVGSTHRESPARYGISYFSAKGPTADGRAKPDLVAPGERILSCSIAPSRAGEAVFEERSGTSMAAPHVSGCIAALLSVRPDLHGDPWEIKALLQRTAMSLGRDPDFQGAGLVDLMNALLDNRRTSSP